MPDDPHFITPHDAAQLTARWRDSQPAGALNAGQFDRIAFDTLLGQPGCAGIRIYLGLKPDDGNTGESRWTFVLVGTDANGDDMLANGGGTEEQPLPCPPFCSQSNSLNGGT